MSSEENEPTELEEVRQPPAIDPTLGRMMDSLDRGIQSMQEMQKEQIEAQERASQKMAKQAQRQTEAIERLSSSGIRLLIIIVFAMLCASLFAMYTGNLQALLNGAKDMIPVLLAIATGAFGYANFKK